MKYQPEQFNQRSPSPRPSPPGRGRNNPVAENGARQADSTQRGKGIFHLITHLFHSPYEMPTEWSAGLQPAWDRRARKANYKPALHLANCSVGHPAGRGAGASNSAESASSILTRVQLVVPNWAAGCAPFTAARMATTTRPSQRGVALVITLIMLSVITFLTVAFLAVSRRDRASVTTSLNQTDSRFMADTALARFQAELISRMMARSNLLDYELMLTRNYINPLGYDASDTTLNTNNVNYDFLRGGGGLSAPDQIRNIGNLFFDPRAPVYVKDRFGVTDFRFYLDYNRNGRFETNGLLPVLDNSGQPIKDARNVVISNLFVGEPEWIGVLQNPELPHGPNNRFVGRYLYLALPISKTLDLNYIHNYAKGNIGMPDNMNAGDGFLRNQGFGSWELNFASFLVDLNTNMYVSSAVTLYEYLPDLSSGTAANRGDAFNDARSFLKYRYDGSFLNLASVANLFPGGGGASNGIVPFRTDFIDGYTTRPALLSPFVNFVDPDDKPTLRTGQPWSGADNRNHFFNPQELFDGNRTSQNFTNKLLTVMTNQGSYDRYTFARLLESIGTGSAPEVLGKININYTNDPTVNVVNTNFIPWTPIQFFTNVAARLIKDNLIHVLNPDGTTNKSYMFNTEPTNQVRADFSYANIQIFPTNEYSAPIHRLLQLAANIYDATTTNRFPTVFRPIFGKDATGTNIVRFVAETNAAFIATSLAGTGMQNRYAVSNFNGFVWGVPLVIGAKKGFPNFNEFVVQTSVQVSRNLQIRKKDTNYPPVIVATNQMLQLGISNVFGLELWNSYRLPYTNQLLLLTTNRLSMVLTNEAGVIIWPQNRLPLVTNFSVPPLFSTFWPGTSPTIGDSFVLPMATIHQEFLTNSQYFASTKMFSRPTTNFEANVGYPNPSWGLSMTNQLLYILIDVSETNNQHVVDFVNLDGLTSSIDIGSELLGSVSKPPPRNTASSPVETVWKTNRLGGTTTNFPTQGMVNQIQISLGNIAVDDGDWTSYNVSKPNGPQKALAIDNFRRFMGEGSGSMPPNVVAETPFNPTWKFNKTVAWQVNDPLVHYTVQDLVYLTNTVPIKPPSAPAPSTNLKKLNDGYRPWGGNHPPGENGQITDEGFNYDFRVKDPGMRASDDWDFPTNKFPSIGWLGRVHRGTPWQTIYLKAGISPNWVQWAGRNESHPANDWRLMDVFTTSANDNAARGLLSVNQTNLAAWSAVLGGTIALKNSLTDNQATANQQGPPQFQSSVIAPNSSELVNIVNDINRTRSSLFGGVFRSLGQILAVPSLSMGYTNLVLANGQTTPAMAASPFLTVANTPDSPNLNNAQRFYGLNDEAVERIPRQILSLLKLGEPRYVIYSYGQSLKPANQSLVLSPPDKRLFNLVTNYQITGEVATRTILRVEGTPQNPRAVIESYNVLPAD